MSVLFGPVGAVLLSAALAYAGNGLQGMILPLRGVAESFPTWALGLLGTAFAAGFMGGCLGCPLVIRRVGHIRAMAVFAAAASSAVLGYVMVVDPWAWLLLRLASGASLAGVFMVIESWLNEQADNTTRGRVFGAYMIVNFAAVTAGQMLAAAGDPAGFGLFALACIGICWALVPVGLTRASSPAPPASVRIRVLRLLRLSPVGAVGAAIVGFANGTFGTLGVVYVSGLGFSTLEVTLFASAAIAGAAVMQLPAGALSDRIDRRTVIVAFAAAAVGVGLWMGLSARSGLAVSAADLLGIDREMAWVLAAFLYGAVAYPLYGLCVAHMNDFVDREDFVEASSGVLLLWSIGAAAGPFLAGFAMSLAAPVALFFVIAAAHGALALFALWRMTRRAAPATEDKGSFVAVGAVRTTTEAIVLDPRSGPLEDSLEAPPHQPAGGR